MRIEWRGTALMFSGGLGRCKVLLYNIFRGFYSQLIDEKKKIRYNIIGYYVKVSFETNVVRQIPVRIVQSLWE